MEKRSTQSGTTATESGDNWTHVQDKSQRKRIQNRVAQRTYRQKYKSRMEALEQWRDAAMTSTTVPPIPPDTSSPVTEAESGAEQKAVSIAFSTHQPTRTHDVNRDLALLDPNTPPEQGNNAIISHQGVLANTLTPNTIPDSPFVRQEPLGSGNSSCGPDCTALPMWDSNDDDMLAIYEATVSDFQSPVLNDDILPESPPMPLTRERFSSPSNDSNGPTAGKSVLHLAAEIGHRTSVLRLLEVDIDIHSQDRAGQTALHLAIQNSHEDVVQALLSTLRESRKRNAQLRWTNEQVKAFVNTQNRFGQTALHLAAASRKDAIVEMLLETDIDLELGDNNGYKALHLAVLDRNDAIVGLLVKRGANVNSKIGG